MKKNPLVLMLLGCIGNSSLVINLQSVDQMHERNTMIHPLHTNGSIVSINPFEPQNYDYLDPIDQGKISKKEYIKLQQWYANADVAFFKVCYWSDGIKVMGVLGKPKNKSNEKRPLIIYNRGGYGEYSKIDLLTMYYQLSDFIHHGYIVLGSQYRGNDGGEGVDHCGGDDLNDVLNLIPVAQQLDDIDTNRLYMVGYSRGGMMAYMALRQLKSVKAAAILAGISDLFLFEQQRPDLHEFFYSTFPHIQQNKAVEFTKRSAVRWAGELNTPLLLIHGEQDTVVDVAHSKKVAEQLAAFKKTYVLKLYPQDDHSFSKNRVAMNKMILDWFAQYR